MPTKATPAAKKAAPKTKKVTPPPSNLIRILSTVALINGAQFAKETPAKQTATLTEAGGKPIEFVADFSDMQNALKIRDDLLAGKDVTRELEFNAINLTDADRAALVSVGPILAKIAGIGPAYPWAEGAASAMTFTTARISRNGYWIGVTSAKAIWAKASKLWSAAAARAPDSHWLGGADTSYGSSRRCHFYKDRVEIGCQTIPRVDVEAIARHYGWAPTMHKPRAK